MFDKVREKINRVNDEENASIKKQLLVSVHRNIRKDINWQIGSLILVVILSVLNLKSFCEPDCYKLLSRLNDSILLTVFVLCIAAIKDIIKVAFLFSDYLIKEKSE